MLVGAEALFSGSKLGNFWLRLFFLDRNWAISGSGSVFWIEIGPFLVEVLFSGWKLGHFWLRLYFLDAQWAIFA